MKNITLSILALFAAMPLHGQGISIIMKETGPIGQTAPTLQTDRTHARLDIPSLASQVLYDSAAKTLRLIVPLLRNYREYTPASIQERLGCENGVDVRWASVLRFGSALK